MGQSMSHGRGGHYFPWPVGEALQVLGLTSCRLKECMAMVPCVYQGRAAQDARLCYWVLAVDKLPHQDKGRQPVESLFIVECGSYQECLQAICKEAAYSCVQQLLSIPI
jgi:hypothetical protein